MKIVDICNQIFIENQSPTGTSIPAIAFWLRGQVGYINTMLYEDFEISPLTLEIIEQNPDCRQNWYNYCDLLDGKEKTINLEAVSIMKQLYKIYDLQLQIQYNMNSLNKNDLLMVNDNFGGGQFTRVNRNEVSKTLISLRKDEINILKDMIGHYLIRKSGVKGISGDDFYTDISSPYPQYVRGV